MDNCDPASLNLPGTTHLKTNSAVEEEFRISVVAESRVERAVLRTIGFWYPKAKTVRSGERWLIKSAQEFIDEGNPYKADTIWRAIRALVRREILVTERHHHPYRKDIWGPVLWLRPVRPIKDDTKLPFDKPKKQKKALKKSSY
jgi:hypothetical protein